MTRRIFRSIALMALCMLMVSSALMMGVLYSYFSHARWEQLRVETNLAAQGIAAGGAAYFEGLPAGDHRITWISADGTVLYDTAGAASAMENHLDREEVQEALSAGWGEASRRSETLFQRLFYAARKLPDGSVVRLSYAQNSVLQLLLSMVPALLVIILLVLGLSLVLARRVAQKTVEPLNHMDLDDPLSNEDCDELTPLLRRIHSQQQELKRQSQTLECRQEEFDTVTTSMNEGLVLLDAHGTILSINGAARRILDAREECKGQSLLTLNRSLTVQELLQCALNGRHAEQVVTLQGRDYQLDTTPVFYNETVTGAVLLIFDVTEKNSAELMRREFTANVSHELRTPLHTISGCAELLCSGLVKPEDTSEFQNKIYAESQRMIRLVEDIINLSRLDEGAQDMERQEVDLYALAREAVESLTAAAEKTHVTVELTGGAAVLTGIPQLLSGIVVNLCDNAIKYNRPGGRVEVSVESEGDTVTLQVKDTGIGIPPEHQSRVFERFYRVDKSRSKAVGGTGLGLSIVKHSAMIHNAKLEMESTPGVGTTITVRFPKNSEN